MNIVPIYRIPLYTYRPYNFTPHVEVVNDTLTWTLTTLHGLGEAKEYFYVCQEGVYVSGDLFSNSTPKFKGKEVPQDIVRWMHDYAKVFQLGMNYAASRK